MVDLRQLYERAGERTSDCAEGINVGEDEKINSVPMCFIFRCS